MNSLIKQQGSVLLISLAILIILTLMTFAVSNSVLLQDKAVINHRDNTLAQQVAEAALKDAENLLRTQEYGIEDFPFEGNTGLYRGYCEVIEKVQYAAYNASPDCLETNQQSYLHTIAMQDPFTKAYWNNSRLAKTATHCSYGENCPCQGSSASGGCSTTESEPHFELGRYQVILLSVEFPFDDISDAKKITMIDNQYESRTDKGETYFLYKVIATGTGLDPNTRKVLVSYFTALAQ